LFFRAFSRPNAASTAQYAGQYEAILAAQTNFFDGDSGHFARYKVELA